MLELLLIANLNTTVPTDCIPDPELGCIIVRPIEPEPQPVPTPSPEPKGSRDEFPNPRCPGSGCPDNAQPKTTAYWNLTYRDGGSLISVDYPDYDTCNAVARTVATRGFIITNWCIQIWK
jgi:hypothetical protein